MKKNLIYFLARLVFAMAVAGCLSARAQQDQSYIMRSSPYPAFHSVEPKPYNLKWGRLSGRFHGSVQTEFNDNINMAEHHQQADVIIAPQFGIGFIWPISEINVLQFDLGAGYRFYMDHTELNSDSWLVSPDTRLNYQLRIFKAQVSLHDNFFIQIDPLARPEVSGGKDLANFRRLNNTAGFQVSWQAIKDVTLIGGYDFVIDRTITSEFSELDRDDQVFTLGVYKPLNPRITLGLNSSYTITEYVRRVQNDGDTLALGPVLILKLSDFISADFGVNYTISDYQQTGTISDRSDFEGLTYSAALRHTINSRMSHNLRLVKSLSPGFGSNFSEILAIQYGLSTKIGPALTLNTTFSWEDIKSSGPASEQASRYLFYLGTGLHLSKRWSLGLGYSFSWKDSDIPERGYTQNRVTLDLTRQF